MLRADFQALVRTGKSTDPELPLARQTFDELLWLTSEHIEPLAPRHILEIGVASGGTTLLFCHLVGPQGRVVGLDLADDVMPRRLLDDPRFHLILGDSNAPEVAQRVRDLGLSFDLVLIDGSHETDAVRQDTRLYLPLLREGGLAVWHDIRLEPPRGIKPFWYEELAPALPGVLEYFVREDNNGYGLWYKRPGELPW